MIKSRGYIAQNVFAFWLGIASILGAFLFLASPATAEHAPVGHLYQIVEYGWVFLYLAGGVMTAYGIMRISIRSELAGMSLFIGAFTISGFANMFARGLSGVPNGLILLSLSAACATRARILWEAYLIDREKRSATDFGR